MSKRFRLPCKMALYIGKGRPEKPNWMYNEKHATRNQRRSWQYWCHIWQCMPPWVNQKIVEQLKEIYETCPDGCQVDHVVPLKGYIVSGLHVPWNLQHITVEENYHKSNNWWPQMPFQQGELF